MTDPITVTFNVDIEKLKQLGVDPTTSEGKARIRGLFLEALDVGARSAAEEWTGEEFLILQEFLAT